MQTNTRAHSDLCPRCKKVESEAFDLMGKRIVALCDDCETEYNQKMDQERKERAEQDRDAMIFAQIPERYRENDISQFPAEWKQIKEWRPNKTGRGLIVVGDTGKCKTRMVSELLCIAHREAGTRFEYLRASTLSRLVRQQYSDFEAWVAKRKIESFRRVPILFIDDLGKQTSSPTVEEEFFDLVEDRTSANLPILITCNANGKELQEMMSPDRGRPLIRRLRDYCDAISIQ